jgi:hypothetical protein
MHSLKKFEKQKERKSKKGEGMKYYFFLNLPGRYLDCRLGNRA